MVRPNGISDRPGNRMTPVPMEEKNIPNGNADVITPMRKESKPHSSYPKPHQRKGNGEFSMEKAETMDSLSLLYHTHTLSRSLHQSQSYRCHIREERSQSGEAKVGNEHDENVEGEDDLTKNQQSIE
jgi:hypothetical protein